MIENSVFWRSFVPQWTERSDRVLYENAGPDHGLFVCERDSETQAIVVGDPVRLAPELAAYREAHPGVISRALVERGSVDGVLAEHADLFGPNRGDEWDFLYARTKPDAHPLAHNVRELSKDSEAEEIRSVIHRAIPDTWALSIFDDCRWFGYVEGGVIYSAIAMLPPAQTTDGQQVTQLAGFGTLPEARGRGIGAAVMSTITREAFDRGPVGFGMWRDNDVARGLYTKLGFVVGMELVTVKQGELAPPS